jgi:hypothetical protein
MAVKYNNSFQGPPNFTKIGIFDLATLREIADTIWSASLKKQVDLIIRY